MLICAASSPAVHLTAQTNTEWQFKADLPSTPSRDLSLQRMKSGCEQGNLSTCKSNLSVPILPSPSWLNRLQGIGLVLAHISGCSHALLLSQLCKLSEMCMQSASQRTQTATEIIFISVITGSVLKSSSFLSNASK